MTPPNLAIVGCGPGSPDYVSQAARRAVAGADVLVGSRRLAALFPEHAGQVVLVDAHVDALIERIEALRRTGRKVAVLVSGDPGLFSLAARILGHFGRTECVVVPAVSSVQVAFARLGLDWSDARIESAHGRAPASAPEDLSRCDKIAVLVGGRESFGWIAATGEALDSTHAAFLAENLTLAGETVREVSPGQLAAADPAALSIVVFVRRSLLA
jgi:cobalt-precorrin-7 (C5)-methyltransferase